MAKKKNKKRRLGTADRILMALSIVLIVVSAGIVGYVSLLNWAPLPEVDESGHTVSISDEYKTEEEIQKKVVNFLVTGIDYAEGTGRAKLTDVIMVVSYNRKPQSINHPADPPGHLHRERVPNREDQRRLRQQKRRRYGESGTGHLRPAPAAH